MYCDVVLVNGIEICILCRDQFVRYGNDIVFLGTFCRLQICQRIVIGDPCTVQSMLSIFIVSIVTVLHIVIRHLFLVVCHFQADLLIPHILISRIYGSLCIHDPLAQTGIVLIDLLLIIPLCILQRDLGILYIYCCGHDLVLCTDNGTVLTVIDIIPVIVIVISRLLDGKIRARRIYGHRQFQILDLVFDALAVQDRHHVAFLYFIADFHQHIQNLYAGDFRQHVLFRDRFHHAGETVIGTDIPACHGILIERTGRLTCRTASQSDDHAANDQKDQDQFAPFEFFLLFLFRVP